MAHLPTTIVKTKTEVVNGSVVWTKTVTHNVVVSNLPVTKAMQRKMAADRHHAKMKEMRCEHAKRSLIYRGPTNWPRPEEPERTPYNQTVYYAKWRWMSFTKTEFDRFSDLDYWKKSKRGWTQRRVWMTPHEEEIATERKVLDKWHKLYYVQWYEFSHRDEANLEHRINAAWRKAHE